MCVYVRVIFWTCDLSTKLPTSLHTKLIGPVTLPKIVMLIHAFYSLQYIVFIYHVKHDLSTFSNDLRGVKRLAFKQDLFYDT